MDERLERLESVVARHESAVIAFSGGTDSALVLAVAYRVLGDRAVALTAVSASLATREREAAVALAKLIGARHVLVDSRELNDPRYAANPVDRCYFCKSELYDLCERVAKERALAAVFDGLNVDDLGEERPGRRAARERVVVSPLVEARFAKSDVRAVSRFLGLPTWDKPASPCLASRVPHGSEITALKLRQVETCEEFLRERGFDVLRVRHLGDVAKVELDQREIGRFEGEVRAAFEAHARAAGFKQVAVSREGYRWGGADFPLPLIQS